MSVTTRCRRARASPSASSLAFLALMSRKTRTQPRTVPSPPRIGAALSSIGSSAPSLLMSSVWFARPTIRPSRKARVAGFSTGSRLASLTMRNTRSSGSPTASALDQPVSDSATGVQVRDPAGDVGGDDGIADARERGPQPLALRRDGRLGTVARARGGARAGTRSRAGRASPRRSRASPRPASSDRSGSAAASRASSCPVSWRAISAIVARSASMSAWPAPRAITSRVRSKPLRSRSSIVSASSPSLAPTRRRTSTSSASMTGSPAIRRASASSCAPIESTAVR